MLKAGEVLNDRYEIVSVLGSGGMGHVYLAHDRSLGGKKIAVKEMTVHFQGDERQKAVRQFQAEAHLLASLDHPRLVPVTDFFEKDDLAYLVMAFVDGRTLEQEASQRAVPMAEVVAWVDQICEVLEYLHGHEPPVLFRDLKPSNVMLDRGGIRLIDFGIARTLEPGQGTSTFLKGAGTLEFAPIEQFGGRGTDQRSDLYALGATLFNLLTGALPPVSADVVSGESPPPDPRALNPLIPAALEAVILRAMALRKEDRYASVGEMRAALRGVALDEGAVTVLRGGSPTVYAAGPAVVDTSPVPAAGGSTVVPRDAGNAPPAAVGDGAAPVDSSLQHRVTFRDGVGSRVSGGRAAVVAGVLLVAIGAAWLLLRGHGRPSMRVVTTPPGCALSVDGQPRGNSPATLAGLAAGDHVLVVERADASPLRVAFEVEGKTITLRPGFPGAYDPSHHELTLQLAPPQGTLTVSVSPLGGEIWVDGTRKAANLAGPVALTLPEGDHQLSLRAAGYKEAVKAVHIAADAHDALALALEKSMPTLNLTSKPSGSVVKVDGVERGHTPLTLAITASPHQVDVAASGYSTRHLTVNPQGGEILTILAELEPVKKVAAVPRAHPTTVAVKPPRGDFRSPPGSPDWRRCHTEMLSMLDDVHQTPRHKAGCLLRLRGQLEGAGVKNLEQRMGTLRGIFNHALKLDARAYHEHRQTISQHMCAVVMRR